jgi:hypothetical protein
MTFLLLFVCAEGLSQPDTVNVFGDISGEGNLNKAVEAVVDTGNLSNTVFKLQLNSRYVLTDSILVPAGEHLTIIAPESGTTQATAPPQILWTAKGDINKDYIFDCFGDLTLRNIWLLSATTAGEQIGSCIIFQTDTLSSARRCEMEGVIVDYFPCPSSAGGSVTIACKNFKSTFKNCYWKNCVDQQFRYYGRAVSYPWNSTGWHTDSITFENCTFANIGYVLMQENGEYADYVKFNHCTFFDVVMFSLESGWWYKLSVTNCIFANTFMYGIIPALDGDDPDGGTLRIDSLGRSYYGTTYAFSFTEQDRRILFTNSSYDIEKWLRDWMCNNPASIDWRRHGNADLVPVPQPMLSPGTLRFFDSTDSQGEKKFPYMNRANLYDSTDPRFLLSPGDTASTKEFLYDKWDNSQDTNWSWKRQNSFNRLWPLEENLAYTNDTMKTAGMEGFPLGDLYRWWPQKYQQWKAQEAAENDTIDKWLHYGFGPVVDVNNQASGIPGKFKLCQNYPNPFNPTTVIGYGLPVMSKVSVKVYNVLGQEVATLFEGIRRPGSYGAIFDGRGLASGVYLVRMKATPQDRSAPFTKTMKTLLTK